MDQAISIHSESADEWRMRMSRFDSIGAIRTVGGVDEFWSGRWRIHCPFKFNDSMEAESGGWSDGWRD